MTNVTLPTGTAAIRDRATGTSHAATLPFEQALCGKALGDRLDAFGDDASRLTCRGCKAQLAPAPARKEAKLRRNCRTGAIEALSSNGRDIYTVTIGEHPSCTCPAGANGRRCYHLTGAEQRFAAFFPVPASLRKPVRRAQASDLYA